MAEDKQKIEVPQCDIVITRNDKALQLENWRILKGKNENKFYPAPKLTLENLSLVMDWLGATTVMSELQTVLKRKFQNISNAATGEDGILNPELFAKYATEFTSAGMKVKEIKDKLEELNAELYKLIDGGAWATDTTVQEKMTSLKDEILAYRQMLEDKSRKPKEDEEEEPSVTA